jgi:hypothetical protein
MPVTTKLLPSADARMAVDALNSVLAAELGDAPLADRIAAGPDAGLWSTLSDGGWHLIGAGSGSGGADFDLLDLTAVAELCGRWLICLPLMETILVNRWLAGQSAGAVAAGTYCLPADRSGRCLAPYGSWPGIVVVRADRGVAGDAASRPDEPGGATGTEDRFAPSLPMLTLPARETGWTDEAAADATALAAASAVGAAAAAMSKALAYAKQRVQFGKPIGQQQAIAHRLADMYTDLALARSAVCWATNDADGRVRGSAAAARLAQTVVDGAIQVHGGIGFTWEAGIHFYLRHVTVCQTIIRGCAALLK